MALTPEQVRDAFLGTMNSKESEKNLLQLAYDAFMGVYEPDLTELVELRQQVVDQNGRIGRLEQQVIDLGETPVE